MTSQQHRDMVNATLRLRQRETAPVNRIADTVVGIISIIIGAWLIVSIVDEKVAEYEQRVAVSNQR